MNEAERLAVAKVREGTEVLRTGGGISLTAPECNALLDALDRLQIAHRLHREAYAETGGGVEGCPACFPELPLEALR